VALTKSTDERGHAMDFINLLVIIFPVLATAYAFSFKA
jgi:nitrate reductase NapE component